MCAIPNDLENVRERFVAELTEAVYPVVLRHGAKGPSVDVELEVWQAIDQAVSQERGKVTPSRCEDVLAGWTDAAYQVALQKGFDGSFVDLELDLWKVVSSTASRHSKTRTDRSGFTPRRHMRRLATA